MCGGGTYCRVVMSIRLLPRPDGLISRISGLVGAIRDGDEKMVEDAVTRLSQQKRWLAPLAFAVRRAGDAVRGPAAGVHQLAADADSDPAGMECCYGGELYDPLLLSSRQAGICNTYLAGKAYGYFGSGPIAYGPAEGNGSADLLCQYFLRRVLAGSSLGRAALEARQEFAQAGPDLGPDRCQNSGAIQPFRRPIDPSG